MVLGLLVGPFVKQIKGINNMPKGPCILVMNHVSYIDGVLVQYVIGSKLKRKVYFLQSRKWLVKNWWLYPLFVWLLGQIPTNGSIAKALAKLKQGEIIGLFPEAGRSRTGKMQKARHSGLAVMAIESGVPIVPIGLEGTFEFWPAHKLLPNFKKSMNVAIGKQMRFKKQKLSKTNIAAINRKVMKTVAKLSKQEYKW